MRVTILGSGTAVPVPDRFPSGVLVEAEDDCVLVDAGPGTLRRLASTGVGLERIDAVLLTHYHTDHTADVASLLFALRNERYADRARLRIVANDGLVAFVDQLTRAWPWLQPTAYELELIEIGPGSFRLGAFQGFATRIEHTAESLAYRLACGGRSAAFSGDADECDGLPAVAEDVDLFVCEAAYPDSDKRTGHLTPGLAGRAAAEAGARALCLTHFYPECDGHDLAAQASAVFDGDLSLAEDLMTFEL